MLTHSGWIFNLIIPFLLFYRPKRFLAILTDLLFNMMNGILFNDIGSFPLLASAAMLCFIEGSSFPSIIKKWIHLNSIKAKTLPTPFIIYFMCSFFIFQLLFPLRHYFIHGSAEWTGQAHYFSWRMKSYTKEIDLKLYAFDKTNKTRLYQINTSIDSYTLQRVAAFPAMIPHVARSVMKKIEKMDGKNEDLEISVDYIVKLNRHNEARAIKPDLDITEVQYKYFRTNEWILNRPVN